MAIRGGRPVSTLRVAVWCGVFLLASGCSSSVPVSLDEAIEDAERLISRESYLEDVLVYPHVGRGAAAFEVAPANLARQVKFRCLSEGDVILRIDGEERFSDFCFAGTTMGSGLGGVDGENNRHGDDVTVLVEVIATDDVYRVATAFTVDP